MAKEGITSFGGSEAKCVGIGEVNKKYASVEYQRWKQRPSESLKSNAEICGRKPAWQPNR